MSKRIRRAVTLVNEVEKIKGQHYSSFLITINPNKVFMNSNSQGFEDMASKLDELGEFILEESNLKKLLYFESRDGIDRTRSEHLALIDEIEEDRSGAIELGTKQHKLHLHVTFNIRHRTYLQINKEALVAVSAAILELPEGTFHVNIRASGRSFQQYANKAVGKP